LDLAQFNRFPFGLALAASALVGVSAISYFLLVALFGYTYELLLFSNVVFTVAGLLMLFLKGLRGSLIVYALYFVVVLALVEEVLLNSALAWYGLALAFLGFAFLPLVGIALAGKDRRVRVRARASAKVFGGNPVASQKIPFRHSRRTLAKKLQSLRRPARGARVVFEVCGLLFAMRIVFSPFPVSLLGSAAFLPAIYTLIMGGVVAYLWFRRIPLEKIGISRGLSDVVVYLRFRGVRLVRTRFRWLALSVLAGVGVGAVLGLVEYFILRPKPIGTDPNVVSNILYLVVVMMVFVGLTEELLFRGLLQSYMVDLMPKWQAVHLTSLVFGLFHIGWLNPMEVLFAYSAGAVFGYLFIKTGGLTAPVVAHGFGNIVLYMIAQLV